MRSSNTDDKYIVFKTGSYGLALPIDQVLKIIPCPPQLSQMLQQVSFAQMGQRTLVILNLRRQLTDNEGSVGTGRFLLMTQGQKGELCGIPVDDPPNLMEIPAAVVQSVPESYYQAGLPAWIRDIAILDARPILLVDINQALIGSNGSARLAAARSTPALEAIAS